MAWSPSQYRIQFLKDVRKISGLKVKPLLLRPHLGSLAYIGHNPLLRHQRWHRGLSQRAILPPEADYHTMREMHFLRNDRSHDVEQGCPAASTLSNGNLNGLIRQYLAKKTCMSEVTQAHKSHLLPALLHVHSEADFSVRKRLPRPFRHDLR